MLELKNLHITQNDFSLAANFSITPDQTTAIIGPSGGGKSTLLLALAGFIPFTGRLRWRGAGISSLPPAERPVSMLFQEHNLFPHLTIRQNTGLGLSPGLKLSATQNAQIEAALERVGLAGRGPDLPGALSGGQRQRAALACALLRQKPLWLLDEPFAALGPALRQDMLALVEEIRAEQNATLLLVTHNPEDAKRIALDCVFVEQNQARPPVNSRELFANPTPALKAYLGDLHL